MLNVRTFRKNENEVAVRVFWDESDMDMDSRMSWDDHRIDEVVLSNEQVQELNLTAVRFGTAYVQSIEYKLWLAMISTVSVLTTVCDGPRKLEYTCTTEFQAYQHWLFLVALEFEVDVIWMCEPCGNHAHLACYSMDGKRISGSPSKYAFEIPDTMSAEEYVAMQEVEALNDPMGLVLSMLGYSDELTRELLGDATDDPESPELDGDVWDLSSLF